MLDGRRTIDNKKHEQFWKELEDKGMITAEEKKNLKSSYTFLKKYLESAYNNLDKPTQNKIDKQADKFDFRLVDDYTFKRIIRDISKEMDYAKIKRKDFEEILEDVAEIKCVGCTQDYKECSLFKVMDQCLLKYGEGTGKCPYAADLGEYTRSQRKKRGDLISRLKTFHSHFSKIEYGKGGEVRHLTFADTMYGPDFEPVAMETAARGYTPRFICESAGTQAEDAAAMMSIYHKYMKQTV